MLRTRPCEERDRQFCYSLTQTNMGEYFDRNTDKGWSEVKFHLGFDPKRITIFEVNRKRIGFYDAEVSMGEKPFLNVHNVQILEGHRVAPFDLRRILEEDARSQRVRKLQGKVFLDNERALKLWKLLGCNIVHDYRLALENSVYVEKFV